MPGAIQPLECETVPSARARHAPSASMSPRRQRPMPQRIGRTRSARLWVSMWMWKSIAEARRRASVS
eukprot:scaffold13245_cov117-Isochrysis_galbana.AAC.1